MRPIILAISFLASFAAAAQIGSSKRDDSGDVIATLDSRGPFDSEAVELAACDALPEAISEATPTRRHTNAHRLRNGLPLIPPSKRRSGALKPRTSCLPLTSNNGIIAVKNSSTGNPVGFIRKTLIEDFPVYTIDADPADALTVSLPSTSPFSSVFDITATNGDDTSHPLVGAVCGANGGCVFGSGQPGYAYVAGVEHTDANSPPSPTAGNSVDSSLPSESQIWSLNCATLEITAQWINADRSHPATQIMFDAPFLGLTGDVAAYNTALGDAAFAVTFTFVPTA